MKLKTKNKHRQAFTLVELLTVVAITAILIAVGSPALSAFKGSEVSQAVYNVTDTLEQARSYAMSMNTYVYVGVVQDNSGSAAGSMVMGIIASSDGTQIFPSSNTTLAQNSSSFKMISKLRRIDNVETVSLPASTTTGGHARQTVPNNYKLGDPTFGQATSCSFAIGNYTFTSATGSGGSQGAASEGILQIDPQGVVSTVGGGAVPFFEIGLQPVHGNQSNYAAIQVAGLSGAVRIYRP